MGGEGEKREEIEDAKKGGAKILPVMNDALGKPPYLCGDQPTLADLAAASNIAYLDMCKYDLSPYPMVVKWYGGMKARPSFTKTAPQ